MSLKRMRYTYQQSVWHTSQQDPVVIPEYKVILVGVPGVGKTSFFLRVRENAFLEADTSTCPIDYLVKKVQFQDRHQEVERTVKILLYDTAGGEKFRTLTSHFYQNALAGILMYSEDDSYSFEKLQIEVENAEPFLESNFLWLVVGNKSDLLRDPMINNFRIEGFCANNGTNLHSTMSAKTGNNVEHVLEMVASRLYQLHSGFMNVSMKNSTRSAGTIQLSASSDGTVGSGYQNRCYSGRCSTS